MHWIFTYPISVMWNVECGCYSITRYIVLEHFINEWARKWFISKSMSSSTSLLLLLLFFLLHNNYADEQSRNALLWIKISRFSHINQLINIDLTQFVWRFGKCMDCVCITYYGPTIMPLVKWNGAIVFRKYISHEFQWYFNTFTTFA